MNSILGFSEILLKQDMAEEQKEYVENNFKTISLFKGVYKQIKSLSDKKGLKFQADISTMIPKELYGDEIRIREILIPEYGKDSKSIIIALTANAIKGVEEELLKEGFDEYLKKPIEFDKLEKVLTELV